MRAVSRTKQSGGFQQRCAVRATYVGNKASGQWRAHGKYLTREGATHGTAQREAGFDGIHEKLDVARRLDDWQQAGDPRVWKIILSPEFGDKLNLPGLARNVMARLEHELGAGVEWVAVAHYNTGHPHVHIAMRGLDRRGQEVRLPKEFVKHGIRKLAEDWCTEALAYRTRIQALEATRREVREMRYTSLDGIIARADSGGVDSTHFSLGSQHCTHRELVAARLAVLETVGLARRVSPDNWEVRRDFEGVLRGIQKMADRQRTLTAAGVLPSDGRLPIQPLDHRALDRVEGRILVYGEQENGRAYMMLESTDAKIYAINHTRQIEEMRNRGRLRVNSFVRLRKLSVGGRPGFQVEELGTAESILENRGYLQQAAKVLGRGTKVPVEQGWGGWLGRYQRAVRRAAHELGSERDGTGIER